MTHSIDVVKKLFAAVQARDLPALIACYHDEVEIHETSALPYGGTYRGLSGATDHARAFLRSWGPHQGPAESRLDPVFAETDDGTVIALFRHRASDGVRGAHIDEPEIGLYEVRQGKVARSQMFHFDPAVLTEFLHFSVKGREPTVPQHDRRQP